jgi:GNAT superfamily N-acetyltransferase
LGAPALHNGRTVIRDATADDIPRLVEMGERFLTETVYRGRVAVNPLAMARTVGLLLASDLGTVFVSEQDGIVVGMIGLLLFENPITGEPTASELFWWVEPESRGHGLRLLKRAEQWARDMGAARIHMIAPADTDVGRLYQRCGYRVLETSWQLDLTSARTKAIA